MYGEVFNAYATNVVGVNGATCHIVGSWGLLTSQLSIDIIYAPWLIR